MMSHIKDINFEDFTECFPAFIIMILIPFTFSIVDGIAFGFIIYPIVKIAAKKGKDVSIPTYIIGSIFLIYFILSAMHM